MIKSNNIIARDMLDILRECKGRKIETLLQTDQDFETSFEVVILRFHDFDIEIWSLEQPDKEGGLSDLAKIIIKKNPAKDSPCPVGKYGKNGEILPGDFTKKPIGERISGITVHNELVKSFDKNGSVDFLLANTYAIVISLGKRYLHIVKDIYWSEFWDISFSRSPVPKAPEWDECEGDTYIATHSVFRL